MLIDSNILLSLTPLISIDTIYEIIHSCFWSCGYCLVDIVVASCYCWNLWQIGVGRVAEVVDIAYEYLLLLIFIDLYRSISYKIEIIILVQ